MPRLSCSQLSTFRWSFEEDLYQYKRAGFKAIGLWRRKLQDFGIERGLDLIEESGLAVSNMTWAGGFTGSDGRSFDESVKDACQAIRLAGEARAGCLVVYTGGRNSHTPRHATRLLRAAIDEVLPLAEAMGVTLAIKPMHPACAAEWTFLTSLPETVELIASYGCSRLQLAYDTYQFPLHGRGLSDLADLAPMIALVQLADAQTPHGVDLDRCPLGEGGVPVGQIVHALLAAGYEGFFDVELMGPSVESIDYAQLLNHSREAYDAIMAQVDLPTPLVSAPRA